MNTRIRLSGLLLLTLCLQIEVLYSQPAHSVWTYIGTVNNPINKGISVASFDTLSGQLSTPILAAEAISPNFFVIHPNQQYLYTVNKGSSFEGKPGGGISAYRINPVDGKLALVNAQSSGGDDPCYVSLDAEATHLLVANYSGGNVAVFEIEPNGAIGRRTAFIQQEGHSINTSRQASAHAHSIKCDPSNRFVLVCDLGADKVFIYQYDARQGILKPNNPAFVTLKPGSGPRHLTFSPNGKILYVMNELEGSVAVFNWDAAEGKLTEKQTISALPVGFTEANKSAEIIISPNGEFLYCTNRGHNSIATFAVDPQTGILSFVAHTPTFGSMPRNFTFDPSLHWILLSNHESNNIVIYQIQPETGLLTPTGQQVLLASPYCIRFLSIHRP